MQGGGAQPSGTGSDPGTAALPLWVYEPSVQEAGLEQAEEENTWLLSQESKPKHS